MAVEIGTLVLKGRFGTPRGETAAPREDLEAALDALRAEILREIDERLETAERRARER